MKRALLLLACACAATAQAASAQPEEWFPADYSTKETRALTHAYARCVVKRQATKASQAIVANIGNDAILRDYPMLIRGECLSREVRQSTRMRFTGDLYRYALADALVNRELAGEPAPNLASAPRLVHHEAGEPPRPVDSKGRKLSERKLEAAQQHHAHSAAFAFLSLYGECVVRADSAGAKALLLTVPDGAEEAAGFTALRPSLARCLPEGRTLRSGKVALRGSIAVNYYRLAHSARAAAGGVQ